MKVNGKESFMKKIYIVWVFLVSTIVPMRGDISKKKLYEKGLKQIDLTYVTSFLNNKSLYKGVDLYIQHVIKQIWIKNNIEQGDIQPIKDIAKFSASIKKVVDDSSDESIKALLQDNNSGKNFYKMCYKLMQSVHNQNDKTMVINFMYAVLFTYHPDAFENMIIALAAIYGNKKDLLIHVLRKNINPMLLINPETLESGLIVAIKKKYVEIQNILVKETSLTNTDIIDLIGKNFFDYLGT